VTLAEAISDGVEPRSHSEVRSEAIDFFD
jgi:hypothetical protein